MKKEKILVIVAHPDDEVLGAGGTLIKHIQAGNDVYCLILGEGAMSRDGGTNNDLSELRKQARSAAEVIGFKEVIFAKFPDNRFDSVALLEIIKEIERHIVNIKPDVVYTHYEHDLNIDHRLTFQAVMTACRPIGDKFPREIIVFETLSSTEWKNKDAKAFAPNLYVDIENVLDKKIAALQEYKNEIRQYPHPRSIEGIKILAQYRGLESGLKFAEAFCSVRSIKS